MRSSAPVCRRPKPICRRTVALTRSTSTVLKAIIADPNVPSVGGHIQYGRVRESHFAVYGIVELDEQDVPHPHPVHYWRGALDLNSEEFLAGTMLRSRRSGD